MKAVDSLSELHPPHSELDAPPEPQRVLLIEDNPGDARLIQLMLEDSGGGLFELEHVEKLAEGIDRLARGGIAIVLSDLSLPDSNGLDTFSRLYARAPNVPIIVLSGLNDNTVAVQAVHEGAQDFLVKGQVESEFLVRALRHAIERKRMSEQLASYAEELRSRNAQLQADFNMAREIQEVFMPNHYPAFPRGVAKERSSMLFSHRYLPAAAVGGDFFDIIPINDVTAGVFICDVMGHGMRAALVTAIMRGLVEKLLPIAADPGKFLCEINRSLHAILGKTQEPFFATAFYLVADVAKGELSFASAGHPSAYLVRRNHGSAEPLKRSDPRHGPALGLFADSKFPICRSPIEAHDLVLLFTDGLYEVNNEADVEYGQERLLNAVRDRARLNTEELLDDLLRDIHAFSGTMEFHDDVCIVALEISRLES